VRLNAQTLWPSSDATFTEYIRDANQFRKFERELLVLVTEAQRNDGYPTFLLGLLGRAGAIILGQMNRGLSASLRSSSINLKLSRRFLETKGGIVDHWSCPEANAEDNPNAM